MINILMNLKKFLVEIIKINKNNLMLFLKNCYLNF